MSIIDNIKNRIEELEKVKNQHIDDVELLSKKIVITEALISEFKKLIDDNTDSKIISKKKGDQ